jgi:hypothetical protein
VVARGRLWSGLPLRDVIPCGVLAQLSDLFLTINFGGVTMEKEGRYEVTLMHEKSADGNIRDLKAYLKENGDLVLDGWDFGPAVEDYWGHDDYEYWLFVKAVDVPKVLLELIKDRFDNMIAFQNWLEQKGIDSKFRNWL